MLHPLSTRLLGHRRRRPHEPPAARGAAGGGAARPSAVSAGQRTSPPRCSSRWTPTRPLAALCHRHGPGPEWDEVSAVGLAVLSVLASVSSRLTASVDAPACTSRSVRARPGARSAHWRSAGLCTADDAELTTCGRSTCSSGPRPGELQAREAQCKGFESREHGTSRGYDGRVQASSRSVKTGRIPARAVRSRRPSWPPRGARPIDLERRCAVDQSCFLSPAR